MAEKYELAEKDYVAGMKYKDIATKYDVSLNTVKSWKTRKWGKEKEEKSVHTKQKRVHTKNKESPTKKEVTESVDISLNENCEITDKQWLFCMYYTKYWNATKAYQKVYECDYLQARVEGSRSLTKPNIRKEIEHIKKEIADGIMIESRAVLQKWIDIAFADITDYVSFGKREQQVVGMYGPLVDKKTKKPIMETVNYVDLKESTQVDGTIVTEVKQGRDGISVKLADKMKALDFLTKYTDLLDEKELKQLKVERERIEIRKENGDDQEEFEDDGFMDALKGVEVNWDED
ncbi:terminase small subunit [Rummeliibacillus sp. NPDC094406]|uniref:terminase small subunit n=1 Tax=Rummeliibacillus sp. NPDC094406 TaxID=3364511 RepID=UPI00380745F0